MAAVNPLGTITKKVSAKALQLEENRLLRWALQAEAGHLLPSERTAFCLRRIHGATVEVYHTSNQAAHYGGLMCCGSVWACPLCAAKVSERRRLELDMAVTRCNDLQGAVFMQTYTFSHKRYDGLSESLHAFLGARKRTKQGRRSDQLKKGFQILGTISALEVTWSELNGWHPHIHELVFFGDQAVDDLAYGVEARAMWENAAHLEGLRVNEHGYRLDRTFGAVADYVQKFGHEPLGQPWGVDAEMTKAHTKRGRTSRHYTAFQLLNESLQQGDERAGRLFVEFARYFKGKHQLTWSKDLKKLFGIGEKSDEELAEEIREEAVLLGRLTREQWQVVLANDARGELLEVARSGDWEQVTAFLGELGCQF